MADKKYPEKNDEKGKLIAVRLLQILEKHTDEKHHLTQKEIIDYLKKDYNLVIERKAVGRNLSLLSEMFENESGSKFATSIELKTGTTAGSYFSKRLFEDEELRFLIDSVLSSRYIPENFSKDLIDKLSMLSNEYFKSNTKHVYSLKDWDKTLSKNLFYNMEVIDKAIENNNQVTFDYLKYGNDKKLHKSSTYTVSPYQFVINNQKYYLVAYNEEWKKIGYFRLEKIDNIKITDTDRKELRSIPGYESGMSYKKFSNSLPYMFSDSIQTIKFEADSCIVDQVIDWFGKNIQIKDKGNEKIEVEVVCSVKAMEYWAMQYLNHVEIKFPESLRNTIKDNILNAIKKYD